MRRIEIERHRASYARATTGIAETFKVREGLSYVVVCGRMSLKNPAQKYRDC